MVYTVVRVSIRVRVRLRLRVRVRVRARIRVRVTSLGEVGGAIDETPSPLESPLAERGVRRRSTHWARDSIAAATTFA